MNDSVCRTSLLALALGWGCNGSVEIPRNDGGLNEAGLSDTNPGVDGAHVTADAGPCADVLSEGGPDCVLCGGYWYCQERQPILACPTGSLGPGDGNGGACEAGDGGECFACNLDGVAGSVCSCTVDEDASLGEDGGHVWNCLSAEQGCSQ